RLTRVGEQMAIFPLLPRHSRIIVEAIHHYPDVLDEVLVAVSFLTSSTPFVLPPGEETEARRAHHRYRNDLGDFVSYLRLFSAYQETDDAKSFCDSRYLDPRTMSEIRNVKEQLTEIVSDMGVPILTGGSRQDYLAAIGRGLIQFVCIHTGKGVYQSLTAERIQIHPGSGMFRETPQFIVAGEIVRTSRTWARSVSPLEKESLRAISEDLYARLKETQSKGGRSRDTVPSDDKGKQRETTWQVQIGGTAFTLAPYKGKKKIAVLPWNDLAGLYKRGRPPQVSGNAGKLRARVEIGDFVLLNGERLSTVLRIGKHIERSPEIRRDWVGKLSFTVPQQAGELVEMLPSVLQLAPAKKNAQTLGFLALYAHADGKYWFKPNRSFFNAVQESLASLEQLIDELDEAGKDGYSAQVGATYRRLLDIMEKED
ncbi:MAG: ATP-dependent RNA helicase, partial [Spirochaeta sp.]|nr:ATP-dependent RNA helicase [Spirochaeta sp.]